MCSDSSPFSCLSITHTIARNRLAVSLAGGRNRKLILPPRPTSRSPLTRPYGTSLSPQRQNTHSPWCFSHPLNTHPFQLSATLSLWLVNWQASLQGKAVPDCSSPRPLVLLVHLSRFSVVQPSESVTTGSGQRISPKRPECRLTLFQYPAAQTVEGPTLGAKIVRSPLRGLAIRQGDTEVRLTTSSYCNAFAKAGSPTRVVRGAPSTRCAQYLCPSCRPSFGGLAYNLPS